MSQQFQDAIKGRDGGDEDAPGLPGDPHGFVVMPRADAPPLDDSPLCLGDLIW